MRIAVVGDLHCQSDSFGLGKNLFGDLDRRADVLALAGDLTNTGRIEEMEVLLEELKFIRMPIIAVVGNHDHEGAQAELLINMMQARDICVLDSTSCEIGGVGFIGTKGFCGGFDANRIQPFGELSIKSFVQTGIDEVLRMEQSLKDLHTSRKIAMLHYAPIRETLQGESLELYPFLGSSLLAEAFDRRVVDAIFHGHAHNGSPRGYTKGGIPVYNVSRFVLSRTQRRHYLVFDYSAQTVS